MLSDVVIYVWLPSTRTRVLGWSSVNASQRASARSVVHPRLPTDPPTNQPQPSSKWSKDAATGHSLDLQKDTPTEGPYVLMEG